MRQPRRIDLDNTTQQQLNQSMSLFGSVVDEMKMRTRFVVDKSVMGASQSDYLSVPASSMSVPSR